MIKFFKTESGQKTADEIEKIELGSWIFMENPSDKEIEHVTNETGLPEDLLKAALDEEERARIELDKNSGARLIIVDMPIISKEKEDWFVYSTQPIGIVFNDKYIATVCIKSTTVLNDFITARVKDFDLNKRSRFIYQVLYNNAVKYLQNLRQIDKASNRIQSDLHRAMKNKELLQLLDLEKSLVYFSTSLNANQIVLDKMISTAFLPKYEEDLELLDDVIIENRQAIEMCNVYRDVLSGTMDAYASVISNNQNIVMKLLTAITIILAIPQVIASLFGMNVTGIPFSENIQYGFWIVTAVTVAITIVVALIMYRRKMF